MFNVFGMQLRRQREKHNFTQKELGVKLNKSQNAISCWESGSREPDLRTLLQIALLFNVSVDSLLGRYGYDLQNH